MLNKKKAALMSRICYVEYPWKKKNITLFFTRKEELNWYNLIEYSISNPLKKEQEEAVKSYKEQYKDSECRDIRNKSRIFL